MLITRYLFKNLLLATVFIALALTAVIWLTQSLKLLELIAESDAPPGVFLQMVALSLPRFLEIILPVSLVAAVLFSYNKFIMDNELIVLRAAGFDQMMLARPALIIAAGMTVLLLCLTTYVSPKSHAQMQVMRQSIKTQYSTFLLREGVFNTFGNKMTVYLRDRDDNGDLLGILIHDMRDKTRPPVTITAKRGRIVMEGAVPSILVYDGIRQQLDADTRSLTRLSFSRYAIEVKGLTSDAGPRWSEASERTLWHLLHPDMTNKRDRKNRGLFMAEANNRLATPFNALGFTLVALASLLLGPFNRRGLTRKVMTGAVAVAALQALSLVVVSIARRHEMAIPLIYLVSLGPVMLGLFILSEKGEKMLMDALRRWQRRGAVPVLAAGDVAA